MQGKWDFNPWFSIWVSPRKTIRAIMDYNPNFRIWPLSAIYGFAFLFDLSQFYSLGYYLPAFTIVILSIVLSPFAGYLLFSFSAYLVYFTGKWMGGKGNYSMVRGALVWSNVPMIAYVIMEIILLFVFGSRLFIDFPAQQNLLASEITLLFLVLCVELTAGIWVFVLYLRTLAEVRGYSVPMAILNIILASIIFGIIMLVIFLAYSKTCSYFFDQPIVT